MPRFIAIFSSNPPHTLAIAQTLTPRIEIHPPDGLLLEVTARVEDGILNKLLHQTSAANQLKTGIASSRIAAFFAAQSRPGAVVAPGTERDFLAPLPVSLISLTPYGYDHKLFLTLFRWGIRTLGELAVLPEQELVERLDLQSHPPDSGVVGVSIQAFPAPPQITQHSLLHPPRPNPEKLARTLGRLTALVGETNIGSPVLLDTYAPLLFTAFPNLTLPALRCWLTPVLTSKPIIQPVFTPLCSTTNPWVSIIRRH